MPKLQLFERIANGEVVLPEKPNKAGRPTKEQELVEDEPVVGNAFEERSKIIKDKLNGKTAISPKTD